MATIVTLPQAPNTGLSTLGQVLLAGAADYAQNKRADDREARQRADRLADVADERRYAEGVYQRNRTDRLADIQSDRAWEQQRAEMALNLGLVRDGYLTPDQLKDSAAVKAGFQAAARDGLVQRHPLVKEALAAGDLKDADLGDPTRLAAGLAAFSERQSKRTAFQEGLPEQARQRASQLVGEREQLAARGAELERRLSEPEPQPTPQEVAARALQLAQATKKPGEMPSVQEIAAMQGQAQQEIAAQKAMAWNQQRQDALVQRSLINDRLRDVSAELNTLTNRFGVVGVNGGTPAAAAPTAAAPVQPAATRMTPEQFAASVTQQLQKRRPAAVPAVGPTPAAPTLFDNPTDNPVIARGNQAIQQQATQSLQSLLDDAVNDGRQIDAELQRAASPVSAPPVGAVGGGMVPYRAPDPVTQAKHTSTLLQRKAANEAKVRELRARLIGPAAAATTPVMSDSVGTQPVQPGAEWWREP